MKLLFSLCIAFLIFLSYNGSSAHSSYFKPITQSLRGATTKAQFLYAHNVVRARHGLPPLRWSNRLAIYAKWYANQRKGDCALLHSSGVYGENIFWGTGTKWRPVDAVYAWASQESFYNYKSNSCLPGKDCWHYTQVVWRSSKEVGCAKSKCMNGNTFVVCEYNPHGNTIGQRPY